MTRQRRRRQERPRQRLMAGVAIVAAAAIAAGIVLYNRSSGSSGPLPVNLPTSTGSYLGVYTKGIPDSYAGVTAFAGTTGVKPDVVMSYNGWWEPFPLGFARTAANNGAVPLIQLDPTTVNVAGVASGRYDGYLSSYAETVRAYRHPVIMSFGHEMNGNWYTWGNTKVSPREFKAAWRRLHLLFAKAGARNVTWCWDVNTWQPSLTGKANYGITPARRWWPGARYVDWIGLDAYYETPYDTFHSLFKYPLRALHRIAHKPVLIAETAAAQGPRQAQQIRNLFSGIRRTNVIGAVWFDSNNPNVRENWQLEGQRAAIAAFRAGARSLALIRRSP